MYPQERCSWTLKACLCITEWSLFHLSPWLSCLLGRACSNTYYHRVWISHGSISIINPFMDRAVYRWHKTLWCHCWQCLWAIDSAWTERVGQGKEGEFTLRAKKHLGLPAERTWLLLGGPFLSSFTPMGWETVLLPRRSSVSGNELSLDRQLSCQEQ